MHPGERAPVTAAGDYQVQDRCPASGASLTTKSFCGKYLPECDTIGHQLHWLLR